MQRDAVPQVFIPYLIALYHERQYNGDLGFFRRLYAESGEGLVKSTRTAPDRDTGTGRHAVVPLPRCHFTYRV